METRSTEIVLRFYEPHHGHAAAVDTDINTIGLFHLPSIAEYHHSRSRVVHAKFPVFVLVHVEIVLRDEQHVCEENKEKVEKGVAHLVHQHDHSLNEEFGQKRLKARDPVCSKQVAQDVRKHV